MKTSLQDLPTEAIHDNTVYRKPLIRAGDLAGNLATYNYAWLEQGKAVTPHRHPDGQEWYLFLEGRGEMQVGDSTFPVAAGDFVHVPPSTVHSVRNGNPHTLVFLTLRTVNAQ